MQIITHCVMLNWNVSSATREAKVYPSTWSPGARCMRAAFAAIMPVERPCQTVWKGRRPAADRGTARRCARGVSALIGDSRVLSGHHLSFIEYRSNTGELILS